MARKGDIDSKSVASRIPMDVYIRLLTNSSAKGETISNYVRDVLSNEQKQLDEIKTKDAVISEHVNELREFYDLLVDLNRIPGVTDIMRRHKIAKVLMHEYLK
jgi:uncharacterized protein YjiK